MRKRSSYRPRSIIGNTMAFVQETMTPIRDRNEGTVFKLRNHQALASIAKGNGTINDVDVLIDALNVTEALAKLNVGKDWTEEIATAQNSLAAMASRGMANNNRFVFKAPELTAVNLAMEVHDAQLDAVSVGKMIEAIFLVRNVKRSGAAKAIA